MMADQESTDKIGDMEVVWFSDTYSLAEIVDEFKLPVLVKVVDGFMINDTECLDSGTIITIHGQRSLEKIAATDQLDRDMRIPLDCKHKVIVRPYTEVKVYNTVREICEETMLPQCIQNNREFTFHGECFKEGTTFIVKSIFFEHDAAKGLSVTSAGDTARRMTLPLAARGNFMQVQLPKDRNRLYCIEELMDRKLPIVVEFIPTSDKNSAYGPRLGRVRLKRRYSTNIVYGTNYMDNDKFLISFSRELKVQLQIGRVIVVEDEDEYSTIAEPKDERIDDEIIDLLLHSDPFTGDYHAGLYESFAETIKQAAMLKNAPLSELPTPPEKAAPPVLPRSSRLPGKSRGQSRESRKDASVTDGSNAMRNENEYVPPEMQKRDSKDLSKYEAKPPPAVPQRPRKEQVTKTPNDGGIAKFNDEKQNGNNADDENYEIITVKPMSMKNSYVPEPTAPKQASKQPPEPPPRGTPKLNPKVLGKQLSRELKSAYSAKPQPQLRKVSSEEKAKSTAKDQQISQAHMTAASLKNVLAFSLPLDAAATFEFQTDVGSPQARSDGSPQALRPPLPLPVKDKPLYMYESVADKAKQSEAPEEGEYLYCDPNHTESELAASQGGTKLQSISQKSNDTVFAPTKVERSHKPPSGALRESSMIEASQRKDAGGNMGPPNVKQKPMGFRKDFKAENSKSSESNNAINDTTTPRQESSTELKLNSGEVSALETAKKTSEEITSETRDTKATLPVPEEKFTHIIEEILDKDAEEFASILAKLKLESFSEAFKEMQIDGQLMESIEESELVGDFEMSLFQARKLMLYVRGWKPDCGSLSAATNSNQNDNRGNQSDNKGNQEAPATWKEAEVYKRMKTIKLNSFAEFCVENQVNGELLEKIIDKESLASIKEGHDVKLSRIEERKLYNYVMNGWRPKK
eukprot:Seg1770.6 transcript_id=Seg1770.6/GoldUCD/mRNA.D3Y31 product="hypothetical protein" protein_id=Seg1770.6/GoldUCD/D3Y31